MSRVANKVVRLTEPTHDLLADLQRHLAGMVRFSPTYSQVVRELLETADVDRLVERMRRT